MNKNHLTLTIVIAIVAATLGFFGGSTYASSKGIPNPNPNFARNGAMGAANRANRQGGMGGGLINGTILSKDDQSVTLKLRDGGSKIVFISASTDIGKFVKGAAEDLQTDENVMVTGKTNTDGSVTASSIQIRSADRPAPGQQPDKPQD